MASSASNNGNLPTKHELKQKPRAGVTDDPLVWIDCEMTGLNPETEEILEIFCLITTGSLDIIEPEGFHAVIHWPEERLKHMDQWCTSTHQASGLWEGVLRSTTTPEEAADALYNYIVDIVPKKRTALLAGNSIHADRAFLRLEPFTKVTDHLHYRMLDVTSIKEAAARWAHPSITKKAPNKKGRHKARDDILESIQEAKYYRDKLFALSLHE